MVQTFIFQPKGKTIETLTIKNKAEDKNWLKATEIALLNPALYPKFPGGKEVVLDILATLNTGELVNIELQTWSHPHFRERILYYWSEIYGSDYKSSEGYSALTPAYSLVFVNFPLFKGELNPQLVAKGITGVPATPKRVDNRTAVHSFSIRSDKPPYFVLTDHLRMIFVDLSQFQVPEGDFKDMLDMMSAWCYFIKGSSCLTEEGLKALFRKSEVFKMAESALKDLSVDSSVRVLEKLREKWIGDQVTYFKYATQKGREEGMQQGMQQGMQKGMKKGMEKGMEKGRQEGRAEGKQAVALNMLKSGLDSALVCKVTGLSEQEIEKLKNSF